MASLLTKNAVLELPMLDIVRETIDINGEGDVSFRTRRGKGSGKATEIAGTDFDEFVDLLITYRDARETLAQQQLEADAAALQSPATEAVVSGEGDTE